MSTIFDPSNELLGGYLPLDGTIEFYGRIRSILKSTDTVLDLGAGRGSWFYEDSCETRRQTRDLRSLALQVVGADVQSVVLANPTTSRNLLIEEGRIPLSSESVDVIVADFVLEHVQDVERFAGEVARILKPGGYFCARTPHKWQYTSVGARLLHNKYHYGVLRWIQPSRKEEDTFPTYYRLNSLTAIERSFSSFENFSYLYCCEPHYFLGNRAVYKLLDWFHRLLPRVCVSSLFVFMRKSPAHEAIF